MTAPGLVRVACIVLAWWIMAGAAGAQPSTDTSAQAAFSLSSSQIFTSAQQPSIFLTFQQLEHLDFRVYRVRDPERFFSSLKDPHVLGSPEPVVPQDPTLIERVARWKARQRAFWTGFLRDQFSTAYRRARSETRDGARLAQRRVVRNFTEFAQVPLLNPEQLVVAWREVLPKTREPEARRIPVEIKDTGIYLVEAVAGRQRAYTILAVSDLGVLTKTAPGEVFSWTVRRDTGVPQAGCDVAALVNGERLSAAATAADGVATLAVDVEDPRAAIALARCGGDVAVADLGGFYLRARQTDLVAYLYTDRPVYRPGHTVHLRGVLRWRERGALRPFDQLEVDVAVADETDKVVFRATRPADAFGAVTASFDLGEGAALGVYTVRVTTGDAQASANFEVQEYRKPEFEVSVRPASRLVVQGQTARLDVAARYFFGQPVAHARVRYIVRRGFYYSPWRWVDQADAGGALTPAFYGGDQVSEGTTVLDAAGTTSLAIAMPQDEQRRDLSLQVELQVRDDSGREVSGHAVIVAPWARLLLAMAPDQYLYAPGAAATIRLRVVDYEGRRQPGTNFLWFLERLTYSEGRYDSPDVEPVSNGRATTDAEGLATWQVTMPSAPGDYRVRAEAVVDGRTASADASLFIPGGSEAAYEPRDRMLELVADRAAYAPGDTARLVVRGEPLPASLLVTKEHDGVTWHAVAAPTADGLVDVPLDEGDVGDVWVHVAFVRNDRLYRAERRLRVPPVSRTLAIAVDATPLARPGQPGAISVKVTDAAGLPVRAQLSLAVVDEALYGVRPDSTPDPVEFFHRRGYSLVNTQFSREYSFVGYSGDQPLQLAQRRRPFSLSDFKADRPERAEVRREFPDAILWMPDVVTDATGTARVPVTYPDALTTWRITVRAVTPDTRVGTALGRTTVTKDVILRLATPRFLTEGDTLDLPVLAHNYHADPKTLALQITSAGLTPVSPQGPLQASVPPLGVSVTSWRFRAEAAGRATLTGAALGLDDGDRVEVSLPILPFGLARTLGASGSSTAALDAQASLTIPERSNPAARTLEVHLSPTLAGSLLGALDTLTGYPYGCTEQILSGFLPNLLVMKALDQLKLAPAARLQSLDRFTAQGLRRLLEAQHDSGGWGWWPTDRDHPFMTAYALYGLLEADRAGLRVPPHRIQQAADATAALYRQYPRAIPDLKAYLVHTLALAAARGDVPAAGTEGAWSLASALNDLWEARSRLSAYGQALLLLALDAQRDARAEPLASTLLDAAESQGDLAWLPSDRDPLLGDAVDTSVEATAFALRALAPRVPGHATLDRATRWLLASRTSGAGWGSTKQSAMALYGLLAVMTAREERPTTFSVDVIVNGQTIGTHTFTPESWTATDPIRVEVPARVGANDVVLAKRGAGPLYWTMTARYYDVQEPVARTGSRALAITREYFALSPVTVDRRTVYRESPFTGTAKPGDLVLVRLTAAGSADWQYVMIEDPVPAGLEAVEDPERIRLERRSPGWTGSRREYRDARVVQFQERFERGRYEYQYLLKVVTPGTYRAMPAQIAPMYVPGVSASTTTQQVVVAAPERPDSTGSR